MYERVRFSRSFSSSPLNQKPTVKEKQNDSEWILLFAMIKHVIAVAVGVESIKKIIKNAQNVSQFHASWSCCLLIWCGEKSSNFFSSTFALLNVNICSSVFWVFFFSFFPKHPHHSQPPTKAHKNLNHKINEAYWKNKS